MLKPISTMNYTKYMKNGLYSLLIIKCNCFKDNPWFFLFRNICAK